MLLAQSKMGFERTYGKGSYVLPANYDLSTVIKRLQKFKIQINQKDCLYLIDDMLNILDRGKTIGLNYETMSFSDPYSSNKDKTKFMYEAISATENMRDEQKRVFDKHGNNMSENNLQFE